MGKHRAPRKPLAPRSKRVNVATRTLVAFAIAASVTAASWGVTPRTDPAPQEPAPVAATETPLSLPLLDAPLVEPPTLTPALPTVHKGARR